MKKLLPPLPRNLGLRDADERGQRQPMDGSPRLSACVSGSIVFPRL